MHLFYKTTDLHANLQKMWAYYFGKYLTSRLKYIKSLNESVSNHHGVTYITQMSRVKEIAGP